MARRSTVAVQEETSAEKVTVGMQFRSVIADCNALWEVIAPSGRNVWLCRVADEPFEVNGKTYPGDHAGREDVFRGADILRSVKAARFFEQRHNDNDRWWDSLTVGSILHYNNGFNQYVRCKVVMGKDIHNNDRRYKIAQPIALVGQWRPFDLPRRMRDGNVIYPYHAKHIAEGIGAWRANMTSVFESPSYGHRAEEIDPRPLPALDLSVPPMTLEEAAAALKWQAIQAAKDALSEQGDDPDAKIEAARAVLARYFRDAN